LQSHIRRFGLILIAVMRDNRLPRITAARDVIDGSGEFDAEGTRNGLTQ
jgi:hypothetical protein